MYKRAGALFVIGTIHADKCIKFSKNGNKTLNTRGIKEPFWIHSSEYTVTVSQNLFPLTRHFDSDFSNLHGQIK